MKLLGLDFGTKRIGVAVSDEMGWTASGLCVINRRGGKKDIQAIARLLEEQEANAIVMGLPYNMDGSEGKMAGLVRRFKASLESELGVTVTLWDERLSSFEAEGILRDAKVKPQKRKAVVDKLAAALILKSYLKSLEGTEEGTN